jgi:hypothetical protein
MGIGKKFQALQFPFLMLKLVYWIVGWVEVATPFY